VDRYDRPKLRAQTGSRQSREGLVHDGDGSDLFLGELVGPLEVIDLDLALISGPTDFLGLDISGRDRS
jgi:hypothetical protein